MKTSFWFVWAPHMGEPVIYGVFSHKGDAESFKLNQSLKLKVPNSFFDITEYAVETDLISSLP